MRASHACKRPCGQVASHGQLLFQRRCGCSTTLARPQGTGTCTRPRMAIPSVGKMSENVSQGFWNPPVQLA
ncbi:uncharacterized protein LOC144162405 isoform X4 [Haemaphysalis longicornis]